MLVAVKGVIFDLVIYKIIRRSHPNMGGLDWFSQTYKRVTSNLNDRQDI